MTARAAALLAVAVLLAAALAAGLTHASSARYAVADNGVINTDVARAGGGVIRGF